MRSSLPWSRRIAFGVAAGMLIPLYRLLVARQWDGEERLPRAGGFIAVANHHSNLDALTVGYLLYANGAAPHFLAKSQLFANPVLAALLRALGQIEVKRGTRDAAQSLEGARSELAAGRAIVVFPEGTFTHDPNLWPMKGRKGAARLALLTGAPVIPIAHWGGQRIMQPFTGKIRFALRSPIAATVGEPIDFSDLFDDAALLSDDDVEARLAQATDRIMDRLTEMLAELRGEQPPAHRWDMRVDNPTHLTEHALAHNKRNQGL